MRPTTVLLIGERDLAKRAHAGIEASLALFEREVGRRVCFRWVPTSDVSPANPAAVMGDAAAVWCTPGSPYASTAGALAAIRFAREQRRPFLGTCGGFQHALMEFAANVLGRSAVHQELETGADDALIVKLSCSLAGVKASVLAPAGGWYARLTGGAESIEEFNCNYGLSPTFEPAFAGSALEFVARDAAGQVRAFRLAGHPFFVGTLFQPERTALRGVLHPIVRRFFEAAARDGGTAGLGDR